MYTYIETNLSRVDSTILETSGLIDGSNYDEEEIEPIKPDKTNFIFGMHPLQADNVVIDPNYPPQFFPHLYPHLFPHLFPKLYPHYCKNYEEVMKKKKKKSKHERRDIVVVLPDGRNIQMSKKEFLAYQLALAQMGHQSSSKDLVPIRKDPIEDDDYSRARPRILTDDSDFSRSENAGKLKKKKNAKNKDDPTKNLLDELNASGAGEGGKLKPGDKSVAAGPAGNSVAAGNKDKSGSKSVLQNPISKSNAHSKQEDKSKAPSKQEDQSKAPSKQDDKSKAPSKSKLDNSDSDVEASKKKKGPSKSNTIPKPKDDF